MTVSSRTGETRHGVVVCAGRRKRRKPFGLDDSEPVPEDRDPPDQGDQAAAVVTTISSQMETVGTAAQPNAEQVSGPAGPGPAGQANKESSRAENQAGDAVALPIKAAPADSNVPDTEITVVPTAVTINRVGMETSSPAAQGNEEQASNPEINDPALVTTVPEDPGATAPDSIVSRNETAIPLVIVRRVQEANPHTISANPIQQLDDHLNMAGLGPQLGQARLLMTLGLGRYAGSPCSAALIGASGVGKTTLATAVKDMYPPEDVECLTDLTFAAMASGFRWGYTVDTEGVRIVDMSLKLLALDENTDSRPCKTELMGWLRQSTSAEETSRSKSGKGENITIRMLGPLSLWDCRLDSAAVDYQTANRMIPIRMNDSPDALQGIMALAAERPSSAGRRRAEQRRQISRAWRNHVRGLDQNLSVQIEFSEQLIFNLPGRRAAAITHGPRILTAVHTVISVVAWLRQQTRRRHPAEDGKGHIIYAIRDDYSVARRILLDGGVMDERPCIPAPSLELLRRWQSRAESGANQPLTAPALYHQVRLVVDRGNMTRHLSPLIEMELVRELPGRNSNRQKLFQLTDLGMGASTVGLLHLLPSPEALTIPECAERDAETR